MSLPEWDLSITLCRRVAGRATAVGLALSMFTAPLSAQTGNIAGTVRSQATAELLQDVVIEVVGADRSGLTNSEGRYVVLNVPVGTYTVMATFIGYGQASQEVTVTAGGAAVADFVLQARAVALEGVVVTGTAIAAQRREVGNSIELITSEEIAAAGVSSVDEVLRGRIQGLTVTGGDGSPGVGSNINIRGLTSINGRTSPLIYVDGVRVGTENGAFEDAGVDDGAVTVLGSISPQDIERIEVIKGAAASTLYGTDATAGVIQIFTKRGESGPARWTFSTQASLITPSFMGPGEDIDPTGLHLNRCDINGPLPQDTISGPDPDCPASGSWLRNAYQQDYALQVRGGGDTFNYFASGRFEREEGIVNVPDNRDPQRADNVFLRANFSFRPWETLDIQLNNAYTQRDIIFIPDGGSTNGLIWNVSRLADGETPDDRDAQVFDKLENQLVDQFTFGATVSWTPTDNMRHRLTAGFDWSNSNRDEEFKRGHFNESLGRRTVDIENNRVITLDYAGNYSWSLPGLNNFGFVTSAGGQLNDRQAEGLRGDSEDILNKGRVVIEQGADLVNINEDRAGFISGGFFVQQQVGWNNQFFVTGGFRVDSYSTINERLESRLLTQWFPRIQATYSVSDHSWWPSSTIETFRLRGAFGTAGDPPSQTASRTLWDPRLTGRGSVGFVVDQIGNPDVEPERTTEWEVGADISALQGRLNISGQYFERTTKDGLIFNDPLGSQGIIEPTPFNAGDWETWGFEATVDANIIATSNFRWNVNSSYQWLDNEMKSIGLDEDNSFNLESGFGFSRFRVGFPFPGIFAEPLLNPDAVGELPMYGDTLEFVGTNFAPQEISIGTSFGLFNRLNIDLFGYGQLGHILLDGQAQDAAEDGTWPGCVDVAVAMDAWREAGSPEDMVPQIPTRDIALCDGNGSLAQPRDWYDEGDFFRFSSAAASYRIPENILPSSITGATIQFRVQNLNLWTDFNGTDPDAIRDSGVQQAFREAGFIMPLPRTYSLNLRVNF
jgi:TonB-dependent SusC/RagA subfamily outer membrane receptor